MARNVALKIVQRYFPKVQRVVDAKRSVRINVEARDCKGAKPSDPRRCIMARACERTLAPDGALVSTATAYLVKGDTAVRYHVPPALQREIVLFDRTRKAEPKFATGGYSLAKPYPTNRLGTTTRRRKKYPKASANPKHRKNQVPRHIAGARESLLAGKAIPA
ncbi:MAG TPA: hypothetical protein VEA38_00825 [Terriglobales bacterium]|nr:hypothetical protein [Terriglobales bacterium]